LTKYETASSTLSSGMDLSWKRFECSKGTLLNANIRIRMKPTRLFFLAVFLHPTFQDAHGETIAEGGKATCAVVVAQEVEPVFPEMVETVRERIGDNEVGDFRLLNTGSLTPHLVSEIQELNEKLAQELNRRDAENSELKRNNASLEQRLAALEQIIGSQNQN
jgi:ABC-type phosphate transport system auxiliary subunit